MLYPAGRTAVPPINPLTLTKEPLMTLSADAYATLVAAACHIMPKPAMTEVEDIDQWATDAGVIANKLAAVCEKLAGGQGAALEAAAAVDTHIIGTLIDYKVSERGKNKAQKVVLTVRLPEPTKWCKTGVEEISSDWLNLPHGRAVLDAAKGLKGQLVKIGKKMEERDDVKYRVAMTLEAASGPGAAPAANTQLPPPPAVPAEL